MVQIRDQDPAAWASLAQTYADPDHLFPERKPLPRHLPLVQAIQRFLLSRHPRRAGLPEVIQAIRRQFPSVHAAQLSRDIRELLQRESHFDSHDGLYGVITSQASRRQREARWYGLPTRAWQANLTPIPFIAPATLQPDASTQAKNNDKSDLWYRFSRLGTEPDYCHLWLTLEPANPDHYTSRTFGIFLLADQDPSWFIYTVTAPDELTTELRRRGWSSWMPHDHPGSRAKEYTAPTRWLRQPLNDVVLGAHVRTPHDAWTEFIALVSDVLHVTSERIDAYWAPLDDEERERLEQTCALLHDAFTWVNQHTPGSVYASDRYRFQATRALDTCMICGRDLRHDASVDLRIGPVCKRRALERIGDALDLSRSWHRPEELLERMARSRRHVPLSHWAYARPLTLDSLPPRPATSATRRHR